jgi:hypothetical protein
MTDHHAFWRWVDQTRQTVQEDAPDGYIAVVDVRIFGRADPIRIATVATLRERGWTALQTPQAKEGDPNLEVILVPQNQIASAEIRYVRSSELPVGFALRISEE